MKLFILLSRIPYPLEKGDKLRAYHQIKELSKNHEIYLFCLSDSPIPPAAKEELQNYCEEVHFFQLNKLHCYLRLGYAVLSKLPFQVHYFYQRKAHQQINNLLDRIQPDHIYCQLVRTTEYVKNIHSVPKTLDYMDAFSKGMERRISGASFLFKSLFKSEYRRLRNYENLIFDYFENTTIISEQDRNLIFHPKQKSIQIVANGVDLDYFAAIPNSEKKYSILFHGNMNYAPNVDTAIYLVQKILPLVRKELPDVNLLLSGANPHQSVKKLAEINGVTVSGWIDDARSAYNNSKVFCAPLQIGTGLQNKLLEAMAMEIPCITSHLANNALKAEINKEILIGNTPEEYAKHILFLLQHPDEALTLSKNAAQFVKNNYSWSVSTALLNDLFFASKSQLS